MSDFDKYESSELKQTLEKDGFLVLQNVLKDEELAIYESFYHEIVQGKLAKKAAGHRHDLGSHVAQKKPEVENITQVMWPSLHLAEFLGTPNESGNESIDFGLTSPLHHKASMLAKSLLGPDMEFDFDMLITKEGRTETETPWHCDEAYWLKEMPDKRALSFWFPMSDVDVDNGCMWFVPGSHKEDPIRKHRPTKPGHHVLMTDDCSNAEGVAQPLRRGGCTVHTGRTLHYTGANRTERPRRAYIVNFRPKEMIRFERQRGYDHGRAGLTGIIAGK